MPRFGRRRRGSAEPGPVEPAEPGPVDRGAAEPGSASGASEAALAVAQSDLVALGDEVGVLDVDVQSPAAPADAGTHYDDALRFYMVAGERVDGAERPADLVAVGEALERVRYELASARALLDGVEPPAHTAPCLFDPRHGPSSREVPWAPGRAAAGDEADWAAAGGGAGRAAGGGAGRATSAGGAGRATSAGGADGAAARPVPACAADARRLADRVAPDVRLVSLGGTAVPYWEVPILYGPLLVGYYQHFGGAQRLSELLRGTLLGAALAKRSA